MDLRDSGAAGNCGKTARAGRATEAEAGSIFAPPRKVALELAKHPGAARQVGAALASFVTKCLAEGVGFEPTVGLHPRRFSRPLP